MYRKTMVEIESFQQWLHGHFERDDAVGDLARFSLADPSWPKTNHRAEITEHLYRQQVLFGIEEAMSNAWNEYQRDIFDTKEVIWGEVGES